jgi:3-hydroxy-5-phosphonooxypentane-2,4-dione thiolase
LPQRYAEQPGIFTNCVPEDFDTVVASCPVSIVMAGGKKISELDALIMSYRAIQEGATGN